MTLRVARLIGAAGVAAGAVAVLLAGMQLAGAAGVLRLGVGQLVALSALLLAAAVTLLGGAVLEMVYTMAGRRAARSVQTAFAAGVDYGAGQRRTSLKDLLDDVA